MRPGVNVFLLAGAAALGLAAPIAAVADDAERQQGGDRWDFSLAVTAGALLQPQDGFVRSTLNCETAVVGDPSCPAVGTTSLRRPFEGDDLAVGAFVGGQLEVMSPALPLPAGPRLFVGGEIFPTFSSSRDLAKEGDPSSECLASPFSSDPTARACLEDLVTDTPVFNISESSVIGQGSRVTSEFNTLMFGAHFGVAFPVELAGRALRIKPSVGWLLYEVEAEGELVDIQCGFNMSGASQCVPSALDMTGSYRETRLSAKENKTFNAIGPGLDVEMDTGRFGPFGTSLFVGGRVYRTLGDRAIDLEASQALGPSNPPTTTVDGTASVRWKTEVDEWLYRVGIGLRIHWLGFGN